LCIVDKTNFYGRIKCFEGILTPDFSPNKGRPVVLDGNIITNRALGTTVELALKLVEIPFGIDRAQARNNGYGTDLMRNKSHFQNFLANEPSNRSR
jgi:hypothetical protein|tara:strand:- start:1154 stop:1441 length:288 start_codon:yes stop_codon:yes gene_type:complete